jgi:lipid-binding SYLF domain-containing protein
MRNNSCYRTLTLTFVFLLIAQNLFAASAIEIDVSVDVALERFYKEVPGSQVFTKKAKAVLVFPSVIKAGIGIGGEYGEGAMRISGKTVEYYNTMAASIGFQLGAQAKSIVMLFMENAALKEFRNSEGWKAGVDGSVALINLGMGDSLDTTNVKDPIVAFIFGQKGLMYNLTLEGSKFNKLKK